MADEYTPEYKNEYYFLQILAKLDQLIELLTPAEDNDNG